MKTKSAITLICTCISLIILTLMLTAGDSFALERGRKYAAPRSTRNERVIVRHRARNEWTAKRRFINQRRAFYRPYRRYYYGRRAPVVYGRPYIYRRPWPRSRVSISLGGIFYPGPPISYVYVKTPPETVVVRETSAIISPVESAAGNVVATVSTLNVRSGPALDYSLVTQVGEGTILELQGITDDWSYVRLPDGRYGWVTTVFTEPLEPGSG